MQQRILVTGGAGYIGSHVVKQLGEAGHFLITLDNLGKGFREAVLYGDLIVGNSGDQELVSRLIKDYRIDSVLHFAAYTIVPESVQNPLKYYANNTCNTRNLLECCIMNKVSHFVFSSTAAVYGIPENSDAISEDTPTAPINAYGASKLMSEQMLRDVSASSDMRHVVLRYFNVAGCDPDGQIGQSTPDATLLIKVCAEVATGKRASLQVFGDDYPTADGTGVRDYIHVCDLADAHLKALDHLTSGGESLTLNCGYGHGYSVREVIASVERVLGKSIQIEQVGRRAGDPPSLTANSERLKQRFDWQPRYDDLDTIVKTALDWEQNRRY